MAERKKPLLLRALIVVVALFLGLSLNMFQFRNPFRGLTAPSPATSPAPAPSPVTGQGATADAMSSQPSGPASAVSRADPASQDPERADTAARSGTGTGIGQPVPEAGKAPQARLGIQGAEPQRADGAGKAGEAAGQPAAPVAVVIEPAEADLSLPKVTTDKEKAKAAGIGRARPANVAERAGPGPEATSASTTAGGQSALAEAGQGKAAGGTPGDAPAQAASSSGTEQSQAETGKDADGKGLPQTGTVKDEAGKGKSQAETGKKSDGKEKPRTESPEARAAHAQPAGGVSPNSSVNAQARAQVSLAQPGNGQPEGGVSVPGAGKVLEIKTQERGGEFVLTIVTDGPIERVTSFHAKNPARLAVDLWGGWQPSGPLVRPVEGETMEKIRLGAHPDKLRLVIDYKDKDMGSFSEPVVEKQPRGVVVRLPKAAAAR